MKRLLCLSLLVLAAPGCLVHRWSATPDGKLVAGCTDKAVVVADGDLKLLESYPAPGKPAIVEISPDGKWVLYNTEDANELWLVDRAAKSQKKIASTEGFGVFLYNAWSPASNRFAFVIQPKKDAPNSAGLRVYNLKTQESFTAIEQCTPCYAWAPSGEALFAVTAQGRDGDKALEFGKLVLWRDGEPLKELAKMTSLAFLEANSEDEAFCATAITTLPMKSGVDFNRMPPMGLFRMSPAEITRVGTADMGWIVISPDRKHLAAIASDGSGDMEKAKWRLELLDDKGQPVRTLKEYGRKVGKILPMWLGNGKLLISVGDDASQAYETISIDGKETVDVTESIKAWAR